MLKPQLIIAFLNIYLFISCKKETAQTSEQLSPIHTLHILGDSVFLHNVTNIDKYRGSYYISDFDNNRVVICDSSLNLIKVVGGGGSGPGEFNGVIRSKINDDQLYAFDDGNRRMNIFTAEGKFMKSIKYPNSTIASYRFAIDDSSYIYLSSPSLGHSIQKLDTVGKIINQFGKLSDGETQIEKINRSSRHLFYIPEKYILSVGLSDPIIEFYNLDGSLSKSYELSNYKYFQPRLSYIQNEYLNDKTNKYSIYSVIEDAYFTHGNLYLLYLDQSNEGFPTCNKILHCKVEGNNMEILNSYQLEGKVDKSIWITSISEGIKSGELIAYSQNYNELNTYSINKLSK